MKRSKVSLLILVACALGIGAGIAAVIWRGTMSTSLEVAPNSYKTMFYSDAARTVEITGFDFGSVLEGDLSGMSVLGPTVYLEHPQKAAHFIHQSWLGLDIPSGATVTGEYQENSGAWMPWAETSTFEVSGSNEYQVRFTIDATGLASGNYTAQTIQFDAQDAAIP